VRGWSDLLLLLPGLEQTLDQSSGQIEPSFMNKIKTKREREKEREREDFPGSKMISGRRTKCKKRSDLKVN
jgi:hypothetical protein